MSIRRFYQTVYQLKEWTFNLSEFRDILREVFVPNRIEGALYDMRVDDLYKQGYRVLLMDVDNTLVPYFDKEVSLQVYNWVSRAKSIGFDIYLVSNNFFYKRVNLICEQLDVQGVYFAFKPFPFATADLVATHALDPTQCVFIGDQVFTDVIVGNWLRMFSVLVDPVGKKLSFFKTVQREFELFLLEKLR